MIVTQRTCTYCLTCPSGFDSHSLLLYFHPSKRGIMFSGCPSICEAPSVHACLWFWGRDVLYNRLAIDCSLYRVSHCVGVLCAVDCSLYRVCHCVGVLCAVDCSLYRVCYCVGVLCAVDSSLYHVWHCVGVLCAIDCSLYRVWHCVGCTVCVALCRCAVCR